MEILFEINGIKERAKIKKTTRDTINIEFNNKIFNNIKVSRIDNSTFLFFLDNTPVEFSIINNGPSSIDVLIDGREHNVKIIDDINIFRNKRILQTVEGTVELKASMPGKIVKILKSENDIIEIKEGLLIIEAMKMENELKSPKNGRINKILIKEGQSVETGTLLAIIE